MKFLSLILSLITFSVVHGQVANWENYNIDNSDYIKDSDMDNGFQSGGIFVNNTYVDDPVFPYWTGWILSKGTDVTTPGFTNEHSSITGGGNNGSENFAVTYVVGESILKYSASSEDKLFTGMYVTNNTYAYLSMLEGDGFAKKFGGESGNDPDYFLLTVKGYVNGEISKDSVDIYLADYRFDDNTMDYILDEWAFVNLENLQESDSLSLMLRSSDVGAFGMNTPAYVCVDDVSWDYFLNSENVVYHEKINLKSSVVASQLEVEVSSQCKGYIYNFYGQCLQELDLKSGLNTISLNLPSNGIFFLNTSLHTTHSFIKM